jgi:hypothetical protein
MMRQPPTPPPPCLKIDRQYRPRADALDALVDVLQVFLLDESESSDSPTSSGVSPTCFPVEPE